MYQTDWARKDINTANSIKRHILRLDRFLEFTHKKSVINMEKTQQYFSNLSLIESLFCFIVIINSLYILIEFIYISFNYTNDMRMVLGSLSSNFILVIFMIISGYVTVIIINLLFYIKCLIKNFISCIIIDKIKNVWSYIYIFIHEYRKYYVYRVFIHYECIPIL